MAKKVNAGYTIIEECKIQNVMIVIGENKETGMYVTWETNIGLNFNDYYWGHYFHERKSAYKDFYIRIKREAEYQLSC